LPSFYKIYHGNLAFSAVEEESLPEVIDKCYFPLLAFIEESKTPTGLELSAYSLEKIALYRPHWITKFKALHDKNLIELIGSGYMQIIGPLVPYEVNINNQKIGMQTYQELLGFKPILAYVNEQVFSKSMVDIYYEVGYQGIVMEWNNAFSKHNEWHKSYAFTPVITKGINHKLPLLWTDSIIFQKFQRLIHNEIIIEDYVRKIEQCITQGYKALPIYTSDLEVFNYRPGRFETEAVIEHDEWKVIGEIMVKLNDIGSFLLPSDIMASSLQKDIVLTLATSDTPVIVKKQEKYSLSRWAACGRGAAYINALCFNYFMVIRFSDKTAEWKNLLQYWGSDYRTHITHKKWQQAMDFLMPFSTLEAEVNKNIKTTSTSFSIKKEQHQVTIQKEGASFTFLTLKGLCLEAVLINGKTLPIGTVGHGDLDYIQHGADYYTGATVIDSANEGRITDLSRVEDYQVFEMDNKITISAVISLKNIGKIDKSWCIDLQNKQLIYDAKITLFRFIAGSIRTGAVTLSGKQINKEFWYECKNGGEFNERHIIDSETTIKHPQAQSLIQSSQGGIGATDGIVSFGSGNKRFLTLHIDQTASYPFVMLHNSIDNNLFLTRVFFSLQELDDTLKESANRFHRLRYSIEIPVNE